MTNVIEGAVERISESKSAPGAAKKWIKKAMLVNGEWYSTFVNKDNMDELNHVQEGNAVRITFETNGQFKNLQKVVVLEGKTVSKQVATSVQNLNEKDLRITYNGSLKSAIEFVSLANAAGALALPSKKNELADALYEYVKHYANAFTADTYAAKLNTTTEDTAADADDSAARE